MIHGLAIDRLDEALMLFEGAKELNVSESLICFQSMNGRDHFTYILCRGRKFDKALVLWQVRWKKGMKPNTYSYKTMISGSHQVTKASNTADADRLLMLDDAMIEGQGRVNRSIDTFELFEVTRTKGLQIHSKTWVIFMDARAT